MTISRYTAFNIFIFLFLNDHSNSALDVINILPKDFVKQIKIICYFLWWSV